MATHTQRSYNHLTTSTAYKFLKDRNSVLLIFERIVASLRVTYRKYLKWLSEEEGMLYQVWPNSYLWFLPVHLYVAAFPDLLHLCLPGPKGLKLVPDPQLCSDHKFGGASLILTSSLVYSIRIRTKLFSSFFKPKQTVLSHTDSGS